MCERPQQRKQRPSRKRRFISVTKHSPRPSLPPPPVCRRARRTSCEPAQGLAAGSGRARCGNRCLELRLCRSGQSLAGSHPGSTAAAGAAARPSCGQLRAAGTRHPLLSQERLPGARLPAPEVGAACSAPEASCAGCVGAAFEWKEPCRRWQKRWWREKCPLKHLTPCRQRPSHPTPAWSFFLLFSGLPSLSSCISGSLMSLPTQAQREAGPGGGTDVHRGDVGSQRPAWCRELRMLSVCPRRSVPPSSTRCGCSGGGGSMARVWGATAPARLALLLLLMAICSQETCAAPWRAPAADDDTDAPYPDDWVDTAFAPQGKPRGPLGELPKPNPGPEPGLDARGPEKWKEASKTGKYPQRLSHVLKKMMKEKAAHVLSEPQKAQHSWIYGFFLKNPGVDGEGRANAEQVKDAQKLYLELAASVPVSLLLAMILCCLLFWWCRKRKQRWEWPPQDVSSGASSENWNTSHHWGKRSGPAALSSPKHGICPTAPLRYPSGGGSGPQHVGLQTPSDIHTSTAGIKRSFPGSTVPLNRK